MMNGTTTLQLHHIATTIQPVLGTLPGRPTLPEKCAPPHPLVSSPAGKGRGAVGSGSDGRRQADPHVLHDVLIHSSGASSSKR